MFGEVKHYRRPDQSLTQATSPLTASFKDVRQCTAVVCCLSTRYPTRTLCVAECLYATSIGKRVYLIDIESDCTRDTRDLRALIHAIRESNASDSIKTLVLKSAKNIMDAHDEDYDSYAQGAALIDAIKDYLHTGSSVSSLSFTAVLTGLHGLTGPPRYECAGNQTSGQQAFRRVYLAKSHRRRPDSFSRWSVLIVGLKASHRALKRKRSTHYGFVIYACAPESDDREFDPLRLCSSRTTLTRLRYTDSSARLTTVVLVPDDANDREISAAWRAARTEVFALFLATHPRLSRNMFPPRSAT